MLQPHSTAFGFLKEQGSMYWHGKLSMIEYECINAGIRHASVKIF